MVIHLSDRTIVILVSRTNSVTWLMTTNITPVVWPLIHVILITTFSPIPIHKQFVFVLAATLKYLLCPCYQHIPVSDVVLIQMVL